MLLATNVGAFKRDMAAAAGAVQSFGGRVTGVLSGIESLGKAIGGAVTGAGLSMLGLAAVSAKTAAELETALQNVATVWDEAGQRAEGTFLSIADAGDKLLDLTSRLPQDAVTLAEGLYDVASSGFQGTDAMKVLNASAEAASAGLTTTDVAARGLTAILNAYSMSAGQARHVSDVMFQTVNLGVVTFEELASVMGDFVGTASTAGVSIEEANAALAAMTLNGISAAEASTSLNRLLQEFIQPGESFAALLQSMGYESGVLALQELGLHGALMKVAEVVGHDNVEAFAALFPEIRAVRGVLALTAGEGENYTRIVGSLTDETELYNATQKALDEQSKSTSFQLGILRNTLGAISSEMGQVFLPIVKAVAGILQDFLAGFRALPDWIKQTIAVVTGLAAAVGILGGLWIAHKLSMTLFSLALGAMNKTLIASGVATINLSRAMTILKISMGVLGGVLALASAAMIFLGRSSEDTEVVASELKDTLDQQTAALTASTAAWVRDKAVKDGWLTAAQELGISADDLTAALLGEEEALARVNATINEAIHSGVKMSQVSGITEVSISDEAKAAQKLRDAVGSTNKALEDSKDALIEEGRAAEVDKKLIDGLTSSREEEAKAAIEQAEAHQKALEALGEEIDAVFDLGEAYRAASDDVQRAIDDWGTAQDRARRDRHDAQRSALDDELDAEKDALDESGELRRDALADRQDAEKDAFEESERTHRRAVDERRRAEDRAWEESARAQRKALDERQRAEERALDLRLRTLRRAFDDELRAQQDAHDDRMEEIRDEYDERIEEEKERWQERRGELQFLIDTTFGEERAGWIRLLQEEEDAHEDRVDSLEEEGDKRIRTESNAFEDQLEAQKDAYADQEWEQKESLRRRHDAEEEALNDRLRLHEDHLRDVREAEDAAWEDSQRAQEEAMRKRHETQRDALDDELEAETEAMDDRHEARVKGLGKIQEAEDEAAEDALEARRRNAEPTLEQIQAEIDDQLELQEQMYEDLAEIAEKGGGKVTSAVLAQLATMGPEIVAAVAGAGPDAIKGIIESIASGLDQEDLSEITSKFDGLGRSLGESAGQAFWNRFFDTSLTGTKIPGLVGPPIASVNAQGGIWRFADGGEYHVAQIARPTWRVWAEPETGGEAYIPLARSKRTRSLAILTEVADMFGYGLTPMAAGGIRGGSGDGGGVHINMPITINARVAADVDPSSVGRAIATEVERTMRRSLDELHRDVVVQAWR